MLDLSNPSPATASEGQAAPVSSSHPISERVRRIAAHLGCSALWVRSAGPHVVLGLPGENAFARLTPVGGTAYGLAFRSPESPERRAPTTPSWEPLLLVDELTTVVEHALVGVHALALDA